MANSYLSLTIAALLPVVISMVIYLLDKKTAFGKINNKAKQAIIGIIFGMLAILGTEYGIPINGAQVNCRDAAVITAGLLFGGPAGIIAGLIGGIERWVAVAWGVGTFTRVACTVSTILAGFYAAAMRKFMFENKKPSWLLSFAIGVVIEVFHLTMVFVTNISTPDEAMKVVVACSAPMIIANGVSVMLSAMVISFIAKERRNKKAKARISQTIQRWLLVTVSIAFVVTTAFLFQLQTALSVKQCDTMLDMAVQEVTADIKDASDENLLALTDKIVSELDTSNIDALAKKHDVAEINIINKQCIITNSTNQDFVGYNMTSGMQSKEFMRLLMKNGRYSQDYGPISYDNSISRKYAGTRIPNGYIQIGYDATHFQKDIDTEIVGITKNRHVGETGYIIIVNEGFEIVSAPSDFENKKLENDSQNINNIQIGKTFDAQINGEECKCRFSSTEGYYIVAVLPQSEVYQLRDFAMYVNTYMEILVFAVLFVFVYLIIKKVVVNKIKDINLSLAKITGGNLNETIDVRSNEEFESLSDDINSTVDTLKHYIDEASARIDKELEFAKNIQASALPRIFPAFPNKTEFDIHATMTPAKEVGGDFYDFYFVGENTLAFLIADVSGKGIPAAMFMMTAKTLIKNLAETGIPVEEVFTRANEELCKMNDTGMFVTAWLGEIDLKTGVLSFVNAGHNPPLVKHGNGEFEYLKARSGLVLAGMDGIKYRRNEINLLPGDRVYLYTDGVTEATNSQTKLYGEDRLKSTLDSIDISNCKAVCEGVFDSVTEFVDGAEQFDDITMLSFELKELDGYNEITVVPSAQSIPRVTSFVENWLLKTKVEQKVINKVNVVIDEIYSNIANYSGANWAKVYYTRDVENIYLTFTDNGMPYNPLEAEDPDITLSAEERGIGGLGIFMVKKIMDDVEYSYEDGKNILKLKKTL